MVILSKSKEKRTSKEDYLPSVSMIIAAYNEEKVIGRKIENSLSLNYPKDKLEIIVMSDCSTDRTNEIVKNYHQQGVILNLQDKRRGKSAGLNDTVPKAKGEIILFSDANAMLDKEALKMISRNFVDDKIGFVTGWTKYTSTNKNRVLKTTGIHTNLETLIKKGESALGSCVGADGAIFAIRKNLYAPLKPTGINDFAIPLNVIKQSYRGIIDEKAFCTEETSHDSKSEFNRQVRITSRTLKAIFYHKELLNPFKYPLFSFQLISHKVIRFLVPYFLVLLMVTNISLFPNGLFFKVFLIGQFICYTLAIADIKGRISRKARFFSIPINFIIMNCAFLKGWLHYLTGKSYATWDPARNSID